MNPILWRARDNKWTYIEDDPTCEFVGDMDMVLVSPSGVRQPASFAAMHTASVNASQYYSINGKKLIGTQQKGKGILISTSAKGAGSMIMLAQ